MSLSDFTLYINESTGISPGLPRLRHSAYPWCLLLPGQGEPTDTGRFPACGMLRVRACHRGWMATANICLGEAFPEVPPVPGLCPGSAARSSQLAAAASGAHLGFGAAGNAVLHPRSYGMSSIKATLPSSTGNSFLGSSLGVFAGPFRGCSGRAGMWTSVSRTCMILTPTHPPSLCHTDPLLCARVLENGLPLLSL